MFDPGLPGLFDDAMTVAMPIFVTQKVREAVCLGLDYDHFVMALRPRSRIYADGRKPLDRGPIWL